MDFLPIAPHEAPRNAYQSLVVITVGPVAQRRSSFGAGSQDGTQDDNALARIMSGGRRKSFHKDPSPTPAAAAGTDAAHETGTWYWRVRVGVTDQNLVVLPLSSPANAVLTARPPPLSQALGGNAAHQDDGIGSKLRNAVRRASLGFAGHAPMANAAPTAAPGGAPADPATGGAPGVVSHDVATANTTAEEHGWPGVVEGKPLAAIVVPLHYLHKNQITMVGSEKEGWAVRVPIGSAIAGKSGQLSFEFDKNFLGGKAEAELLHHNIETAVGTAPPLFNTVQLGGDKTAPPADKNDKAYDPAWRDKVRGKW